MKDYEDVLDELIDKEDDQGEIIERGLSFDEQRDKYLDEISSITGRNVIAYYSSFLQREGNYIGVEDEDIVGFSSLVSNMDPSKGLDLILNTPGGDGYAAEKDKKKVEKAVSQITDSLIHPEQSHSKHFDINDCRQMGLKVESLEEEKNKQLNEAVMCLHYAYMITFESTNLEKIIEDQYGKMYYKGTYRQDSDSDD